MVHLHGVDEVITIIFPYYLIKKWWRPLSRNPFSKDFHLCFHARRQLLSCAHHFGLKWVSLYNCLVLILMDNICYFFLRSPLLGHLAVVHKTIICPNLSLTDGQVYDMKSKNWLKRQMQRSVIVHRNILLC